MKRSLISLSLFLVALIVLIGQSAYVHVLADVTTPTAIATRTSSAPSDLQRLSARNAAQVKTLKQFGYGIVKRVIWSADSQLIAVCTSAGVMLFRTDALDAAPRVLETSADCEGIAISPDNTLVASYGNIDDSTVRVWEVSTGALKVELRWQGDDLSWVYSLNFSPDSTQLAFGGTSGAQVWNFQTETQQILSTLPYGTTTVGLAFNSDGSLLASSGFGTIYIWDLQTGTKRGELENTSSEDVRFSADGKFLVSVSGDSARLWHVTGSQRAVLFNNDRVFSAQFSADGSKVITGNAKAIIEWDARRFVKLHTQPNPIAPIQNVALSADGTLAAAIDDLQTKVVIWETQTGKLRATLTPFTREMRLVHFNATGDKLVFGGNSGAWLWDMHTDAPLRLTDRSRHSYSVAGFLKQGQQVLVTDDSSGDYVIWETASGQEVTTLADLPYGSPKAIAPDGTLIAIGGPKASILLIDMQTREVRYALQAHTAMLRDLAFSLDGKWLASCANDSTLRIWDVAAGEQVLQITDSSHLFAADMIVFNATASVIATTLGSTTITIWDTKTGHSIRQFAQPSKYPYRSGIGALAFSPDGTLLASSGSDGNIYLWDMQSGRLAGTLMGHLNAIYSLAFNRDGTLLASASEDGTIRIWGVSS